MLTALANPDHTDVIVTSATELVKAVLALVGIFAAAGFGIGIPIHKRALRERRAARMTMDEVHEQLHNDHPKNFRVEIDDKFDRLERQLNVGFDSLTTRMDRHSRDIAAAKRASEAAAAQAAVLERRLTLHIDGREADPDAQ